MAWAWEMSSFLILGSDRRISEVGDACVESSQKNWNQWVRENWLKVFLSETCNLVAEEELQGAEARSFGMEVVEWGGTWQETHRERERQRRDHCELGKMTELSWMFSLYIIGSHKFVLANLWYSNQNYSSSERAVDSSWPDVHSLGDLGKEEKRYVARSNHCHLMSRLKDKWYLLGGRDVIWNAISRMSLVEDCL